MERCRTSLNYLLGRARKRGRVSYWEYRVSHSPKEEEHALLADAFYRAPLELAVALNAERLRNSPRISPLVSVNEEQVFTVEVPPGDVLFGMVAVCDWVLEELGRVLSRHCAPHSCFGLAVDVSFTHFELRMLDLNMREKRWASSCRAACIALLANRRLCVDGGVIDLPRDLRCMLARTLWAHFRHDAQWNATGSKGEEEEPAPKHCRIFYADGDDDADCI